ncbi:MAG: hypothetical protein ABL872_03830 [Lacibacter sp.]
MEQLKLNTPYNTTPVKAFFLRLKSRNPILYWFGWFNFLMAIVCAVMIQLDPENSVLGINAWIKPMKFYLSIGIVSWTFSWLLVYVQKQKAVKVFSVVTVITMLIEMIIITWQAANGRLSHFNVSSPLYGMLFSIMGIAITIFTLWALYIDILFFRQKEFPLWMSDGYKWGIRWGILFFVIFAFEGGLMAAMLHHTVGSADGSEGLPILNWSRSYGDLRVAHFFGMHSLQLLPFIGFYFAKTKLQINLLSLVYFIFITLLFWQALMGYPLIN